jgi:formylglycine-generating enzyme required for sulfatase activity
MNGLYSLLAIALLLGPVVATAMGQAPAGGFPKADPQAPSIYADCQKLGYGGGGDAWGLALDEAAIGPNGQSADDKSSEYQNRDIKPKKSPLALPANINSLQERAPNELKAICDKCNKAGLVVRHPNDPAEMASFDRVQHECASELRQLLAKVRTEVNTDKARPLIEALQAIKPTRENKPHAEDLLDQIEDLVPCAATLPQLRKFVAAMPGPAHRLRLDLGDFVALKLLRVEPGKFMMGIRPQDRSFKMTVRGEERTINHNIPPSQAPVTLTKAFYMSTTPVTNDQITVVLGMIPSLHGAGHGSASSTGQHLGDFNHFEPPAYWNDTVVFCQKVSAKVGAKVRPPTEAEWEYACRAGTTSKFFWGEEWGQGDAYVDTNWGGAAADGGLRVDLKQPNPWGFHGFFQNREWCLCCGFYPPTKAQTDPAPVDRLPSGERRSSFFSVFGVSHGARPSGMPDDGLLGGWLVAYTTEPSRDAAASLIRGLQACVRIVVEAP